MELNFNIKPLNLITFDDEGDMEKRKVAVDELYHSKELDKNQYEDGKLTLLKNYMGFKSNLEQLSSNYEW